MTHWSKIFWFSCDWTVHTSMFVSQYLETFNKRVVPNTVATSFILGIHVMGNWQLSKQAIHWQVSCDHIMGPLTWDWFFNLDGRCKSGYCSGGEGRRMCKGKSLVLINLWHILDFSSEIFFEQLSFGKSLIYGICMCNFYNISGHFVSFSTKKNKSSFFLNVYL